MSQLYYMDYKTFLENDLFFYLSLKFTLTEMLLLPNGTAENLSWRKFQGSLRSQSNYVE